MNTDPSLLVFLALGAGLVILGLHLLRRARRFAAIAQTAVGRVIRLHEEKTSKGAIVF